MMTANWLTTCSEEHLLLLFLKDFAFLSKMAFLGLVGKLAVFSFPEDPASVVQSVQFVHPGQQCMGSDVFVCDSPLIPLN